MTLSNPDESGASTEELELLFDKYKEAGGILTKKSYEAVLDFKDRISLGEFNKSTIKQAELLCSNNGIPFDKATCKFYCILRAEVIGGFCDQEIFADALLFQSRLEEHARFVSGYPNIFDKSSE